jgi:hypothetical protein
MLGRLRQRQKDCSFEAWLGWLKKKQRLKIKVESYLTVVKMGDTNPTIHIITWDRNDPSMPVERLSAWLGVAQWYTVCLASLWSWSQFQNNKNKNTKTVNRFLKDIAELQVKRWKKYSMLILTNGSWKSDVNCRQRRFQGKESYHG